MIFITVGAYDLPFHRLIRAIDDLVRGGLFGNEEAFIQIGHSEEPTSGIPFGRFLPFDKMEEYADNARLVICQGGPGSIMLSLARGKVPIVVPRQKQFGEMVDNHQVLFTQRLECQNRVLPVYDISLLKDMVVQYDRRIEGMVVSAEGARQRAADFSTNLEELIVKHLADKKAG